ncbi:MAG: VWA domain-containing protein, partial [Candidatus Omnitrophota bacterium]
MINMKVERSLLISVGVSAALHLVFLVCSSGIQLPGVQCLLEQSKKMFNIQSVDSTLQQRAVVKRPVTYVESLKFKGPIASEDFIAKISKSEDLKKREYESKKFEMMDSPLDYEVKDEMKPESIENKNLFRDTKKAARVTRKDLIPVGSMFDGVVVKTPDSNPDFIEFPRDFLQTMPGYTPKAPAGAFESFKEGILSKISGGRPAIKSKGKFSSLEEYLVCNLYMYEDPQDSQKYFKITIRAGRDANMLDKMKKEIVFLVDCSLSMQPDRLERFKRGMEYCLHNLNSGDLFNVLAFQDRIVWFRPHSIEPNNHNIRAALAFLKGLKSGESTDTYKALYDTIKVKESMLPSYIILLSDGRPTYGITDSREIINKIGRVNKGERPVFAFSGGSRVNRYLLDFIAYKNRGWAEYASAEYTIPRQMASMYDKIRNPLFLNLRYRVSGLEYDEI